MWVLCPEKGAEHDRESGANRYEGALQTMSEIPYARWHEYDAEDPVLHGLRLSEAL